MSALLKSMSYAYPTSEHARRYWSRMGDAKRGQTEGVWFVTHRATGSLGKETTIAEYPTQEKAERFITCKALDRHDFCPYFLASTLNRKGFTNEGEGKA